MAPFKLDSNKDDHYVGCAEANRDVVQSSFKKKLVVYKLKKMGEVAVFHGDWQTVAMVTPGSSTCFDSLEVNGFPVDFKALYNDLCCHRLRANWLGYCFQERPPNTGVSNTTDPANQFKRMNDVLNWLPYGATVNRQTAIEPSSIWDRVNNLLPYGATGNTQTANIKPSKRWDRVDIINGTPTLYRLWDQEALNECKKDLGDAKKKASDLESNNRTLERRNRDLQKDKSALETRIKQLLDNNSRNAQLLTSNQNLNKRNVQLQQENRRLIEEVGRLRQMGNSRISGAPSATASRSSNTRTVPSSSSNTRTIPSSSTNTHTIPSSSSGTTHGHFGPRGNPSNRRC